MKRINEKIRNEIRELREKLNKYIDERGINDEPELMAINARLDELIIQWLNENYRNSSAS